jgi:cobalt-zinc-cadmium efflux system membrane fusion protein
MKRSGLLFVLILFAGPPVPASDAIHLNEAAQNRAGIVVEAVSVHSFGERIRIVGEVVRSPGTTTTIQTSVEGRVENLMASPGDRVKAGQPILTLRSQDLHVLEGDLLRKNEKRRYMEDRYLAGKELYDLEGISRMELNMRRREHLDARIDFEAAQNKLEGLGYTPGAVNRILARKTPEGVLTIRSPADGVVLELGVQRHDLVQPFQPLAMVGDPSRLELHFEIPPSEASRVRAGDRVEFTPAGEPDAVGTARVITSIPRVDPNTRTVTVRADILSYSGVPLPGIFVEGTWTSGNERRTPSVPESAVIRIADRDQVFVRTGAEEFDPRPVRLGQFDGTRYEVLDGLRIGEEIVTQGVFFLKSALIRGSGEGE